MHLEPFILDGFSPLEHLAFEELLLRNPGGRSLLLFYVNAPSVIIGRNQNPWREVSEDSSLPLYRRSSGGGTVFHDEGNLNWAFIVPRPAHDREAELELIAGAVSSLGRKVVPGPRGGLYLSGGGAGDGAKVSGTARHIGAASVLHHGTLLVSTDLSALAACLGGLRTSEDGSLASVPGFPANLPCRGSPRTTEEIASALSRYLTGWKPEPLSAGSLNPGDLAEECALLGSAAWIYGKTPHFVLDPGGEPGRDGFRLTVEEGRVARLESGEPGIRDIFQHHHGELFSFQLARELLQYGGK